MSIVVFWLEYNGVRYSTHSEGIEDLGEALDFTQELRKLPFTSHVTISSEPAGMVGKPGVDSVENGRTPDGHIYDWDKKDRRRRS